jgi:hypothetical protein
MHNVTRTHSKQLSGSSAPPCQCLMHAWTATRKGAAASACACATYLGAEAGRAPPARAAAGPCRRPAGSGPLLLPPPRRPCSHACTSQQSRLGQQSTPHCVLPGSQWRSSLCKLQEPIAAEMGAASIAAEGREGNSSRSQCMAGGTQPRTWLRRPKTLEKPQARTYGT